MENLKIRALIVEDSSVMRMLLRKVLESENDIEVIGTAHDAAIAWEKVKTLRPDVITLDIVMPNIDGITLLKKITEEMPTPTIVITGLGGSDLAQRAISAGAIDVFEKNSPDGKEGIEHLASKLIESIRKAARSKIKKQNFEIESTGSNSSSSNLPILAIAASTGGTEALKKVLSAFPADIPPTVIVQHMPSEYTKTFAKNLSSICRFEVKEAQTGDWIIPGMALLAPGNFHMEVTKVGKRLRVYLHQKELLHGVRPAADFLFESVAKHVGANAIGVILTGMGKDGARGLLTMKKAGSYNIAQDERTSVVFGMPKEAIQIGAIHQVVPLEKVADTVLYQISKRKKSI